MKYSVYILLLIVVALSCKKEAGVVKPVPISSLTIVNAIIGSDEIIADLTGADSVAAYYSTAPQISYGSYKRYSIPSGSVPIVIYSISDTITPVFKSTLSLNNSSIYSLFLCGTSPKQPDTLLTQDLIPYHSSIDSTIGIRFVNLSSGNPVSVNIQDSANGSEVSSLGYKGITVFKNYAVTTDVTEYIFEIRDAVTGDLLITTESLLIRDPDDPGSDVLSPFRDITIAVTGEQDPSASVPIGIMLIKYY